MRERRRRRKGKDEGRVPFLDRQVRGEGEKEEEEEGRVVAEATLFHLVVFLRRSSRFPCSSVPLMLRSSFLLLNVWGLCCNVNANVVRFKDTQAFSILLSLGLGLTLIYFGEFFFSVSQ